MQKLISNIICNNSVVTSSPGGGVTSLLLYLAANSTFLDKQVLYISKDNIDTNFIKKYNGYDNIIFVRTTKCNGFDIVEIIQELYDDLSLIIIDPADYYIQEKNLLNKYIDLSYKINVPFCFASQIRVNPTNNSVYSTVENKIDDNITRIWIRDTTNIDDIFTFKYIDITEQNHRVIKERFIGKVNSSGHFIEVKDANY